MHSSEKGLVLIAVLIFMQIFALLGLYALENILLQLKINNMMWFSHQIEIHAENIINRVEKNFLFCINPSISINEVKNKSFSWWQQHGCSIDNYFFYVAEFLGEDPCAGIMPNKKKSAAYYRIYLFGASRKMHILWQDIMVDFSGHAVQCKGRVRGVAIGSQGFREIK